MIEGYCVKCKAKRPIADAIEEQMKNGRKAVKGKCPTCGAVMFKILGGKALATPPPTPDPAQPAHPASAEVPAAPAAAAAASNPNPHPASPAPTAGPTAQTGPGPGPGPTGPSNV